MGQAFLQADRSNSCHAWKIRRRTDIRSKSNCAQLSHAHIFSKLPSSHLRRPCCPPATMFHRLRRLSQARQASPGPVVPRTASRPYERKEKPHEVDLISACQCHLPPSLGTSKFFPLARNYIHIRLAYIYSAPLPIGVGGERERGAWEGFEKERRREWRGGKPRAYGIPHTLTHTLTHCSLAQRLIYSCRTDLQRRFRFSAVCTCVCGLSVALGASLCSYLICVSFHASCSQTRVVLLADHLPQRQHGNFRRLFSVLSRILVAPASRTCTAKDGYGFYGGSTHTTHARRPPRPHPQHHTHLSIDALFFIFSPRQPKNAGSGHTGSQDAAARQPAMARWLKHAMAPRLGQAWSGNSGGEGAFPGPEGGWGPSSD
jgi:hypothetical protein